MTVESVTLQTERRWGIKAPARKESHANGSGGVLHVVVEAGAGSGNDHGRNGALGPPRIEQRLEVDDGIPSAAGA